MNKAAYTTGLRLPGQFIPELESLRGWAILLVVAFHYFGIMTSRTGPLKEDEPAWLQVVASGHTGVGLFFVLSGFLLSQPFIEYLRGGSPVDIKRFYLARVLRVIPLYYLFVGLAWLVTGNSAAALKALAFLHVGFSIAPFSIPWWSLCTEMQFYLVLPWIMLLLHSRYGRWLVFAGGMIWAGTYLYYFHHMGWLQNPKNWAIQASLFGRGQAFLIGALCAAFYVSSGFQLLVRRQWLVGGLLVVLLLSLYELLSVHSQLGWGAAKKSFPMYYNIEAVLWGGILLCCVAWKSRVKVIFINPLFNRLGVLSYSIYLVHVPVQAYAFVLLKEQREYYPQLHGLWGDGLMIVCSLSLIWLLSSLTYYCVEQPVLKLKSRMPTYLGRGERQQPLSV
ncbi:MAG: acyltransferase family protein [Pseudomonas sp.]